MMDDFCTEEQREMVKKDFTGMKVDVDEDGYAYATKGVQRIKINEKPLEMLKKVKEPGMKKGEFVLMTKFSPVPFAERLMETYNFVYDKNSILWVYDVKTGLWVNHAEQFIKTTLRKNLMGDEQQKKHYIDEIINHIKDINYNQEFTMDNNPYLIAFKNQVYSLKDDKFYDFKPEFYLTNKLDVEIDENTKECPMIDKFFSESVGEEYKQVLYDLVAYTLFKNYPYQKIFFVYGMAGTGKSVFLSLLESFLGKNNTCSVEPRAIQQDKHSTSQMLYKLANIVSDINYDDLENITQVKKLCGGDTVQIREMYKDPYSAKLYAKQVYSTNKLPVVKEKTNAWYRRVYLIEFATVVKNRDPFLLEKMKNPEEIKGLAYKCLQALKELYNNNFIFTFDINEQKMAQLYEELSNPMLMFANESCVEGQDCWLYKFEFEERLNNWLKFNHFPIATRNEINNYMKNKYNESQRSYGNDKTYRVWAGLKWKNGHEAPNLNQYNHFNQVSKKVYEYKRCFENPVKSVKSVRDDLK